VGKTAIIDLGVGEKGLTRYAASAIDHLPGANYIRIHSVHNSINVSQFKGESYPINTYRSAKDVIPKTIFFLPAYLLKFSFLLLKKKISAVYFPHFNHWNIFFALIAKLFTIKIIYTVHDGKMHLGEFNPITQFEMNCLIWLATDLIFLSDSVRKEVEPLLKNKRTYIVPHGIMNIPGIEELSRITSRPTILFLGRISKYKGVEMLCDAMKDIAPESYERFVIAGEPNYNVVLPELDKMEFHNHWLNENDIAEFVNMSDIMVYPYIEATQSGALTIAIQALRPIVCTNVGGLAEQVGDGEALVVPPDAVKIKEALQTLLEKPNMRDEMRINLRRKKQALSWQLISQQIESIVQA